MTPKHPAAAAEGAAQAGQLEQWPLARLTGLCQKSAVMPSGSSNGNDKVCKCCKFNAGHDVVTSSGCKGAPKGQKTIQTEATQVLTCMRMSMAQRVPVRPMPCKHGAEQRSATQHPAENSVCQPTKALSMGLAMPC